MSAVQRVVAVLVGQHPGHLGRGGGLDELGLLLRRGARVHGDYQGVLALERCDEGSVVVVGDPFDLGAGRCRVCALGPRDGCFVCPMGRRSVFFFFSR